MPHAMLRLAASPHRDSLRFLDGRMPSGPQVRAFLRNGLATLQDLERRLAAGGSGDAEALHRHRVELRRIRVIAGQFKSVFPRVHAEQLRTLLAGWGRCSNRARDLEVMLEARQHHGTLVPADLFKTLDGVYAALSAERDRECRAVMARLAGAEHRGERAKVADILAGTEPGPDDTTPMQRLVRRRAWHAYRRICAQAAVGLDVHEPAVVHAIRIRCKKLRYILDAGGHLTAPEAHEELRSELRAVQTTLGSFNDTRVQLAELHRRTHRYHHGSPVRLAIEELRTAIERESASHFDDVAEAVASLTSKVTRKRYSRLLRRS